MKGAKPLKELSSIMLRASITESLAVFSPELNSMEKWAR
jgi:hypothetical protein